jgi:hypothetical protein
MELTRRRFVCAAAGAALAGRLSGIQAAFAAPTRAASNPVVHFPEQHIIQNLHVVRSDGVLIFEPPLHSEVVTARLELDGLPAAVAEARVELERRLKLLDERYESTPEGLGVAVAYGQPYFDRFVPSQTARELPIDRRASAARHRQVFALEPSERFPSDPNDLLLESNDVAVLLRSDSLDRIADGFATIFAPETRFLKITSRRAGFAGGGFGDGPGLPKLMATAAGVPGADAIPYGAELFLGFTSTPKQKAGARGS